MNISMNFRFLILSAAFLYAGGVAAQASTDVNMGGLEQHQDGLSNRQVVNIGNASGNNRAVVNIDGDVVVSQSGLGHDQQVDIGNADDGSSTVHVGGRVIVGNDAKVSIGNR
jgi:hypothetical protein